MYPEQLTGAALDIWKEVSNIPSIILLTILTVETVSWKQSQELYWLQDFILPPNHRQKAFYTEFFRT